MFIGCLILNHISEICWILKISTSNTNLLLHPNEESSILHSTKSQILVQQ